MRRGVRFALFVLVLAVVAPGCPQDQKAGTGPLAGGYLANAKSLERALGKLVEQLDSADGQLAAGSAHVSFEPLATRDLERLSGRLDLDTKGKVDDALAASREVESGLDELAKTPPREKPSPARLDELRRLVARATTAARAARERLARFIDQWS